MNDNGMIASNNPGTSTWTILLASVLSGAVSATVGYMLGARKPGSCSCKKTPEPGNGEINGGEKAA